VLTDGDAGLALEEIEHSLVHELPEGKVRNAARASDSDRCDTGCDLLGDRRGRPHVVARVTDKLIEWARLSQLFGSNDVVEHVCAQTNSGHDAAHRRAAKYVASYDELGRPGIGHISIPIVRH